MKIVKWSVAVFLCLIAIPLGWPAENSIPGVFRAASIFDIKLSSELPKVGAPLLIFVQEVNGFEKYEFGLVAKANGIDVQIDRSAQGLWVSDLGIQSRVQDVVFEVAITAKNARDAERIRSAISILEREILLIRDQLSTETDPGRIQELQARLAGRNYTKSALIRELDSLSIQIGTERVFFRVEGDSQNLDFPRLIRLVPGVGVEAGGQVTRIIGRNLLPNPYVKIGGANASVISSSESEVRIIAPPQSGLGAKDVEITFQGSDKNAVLKAGYFATTPILLKNVKPVSVTNGYYSVTWPNSPPTQLNGSTAYDENGDAMRFEWRTIKSPNGSTFVPGQIWKTSRNPTFSADLPGLFVFEFKAIETSTVELLESSPVQITIEVKQ